MKKVLLIDDEKPTLTMFRLFLGAYGYDVYVAEDGTEGLEVLAEEKPPIVFTDIKMPGIDGLEVLRRIKQIAPLTEVIVITGHGDLELTVRALDLDATDFINKPVQREALDSALKRAEERLRKGRGQKNRLHIEDQGPVTLVEIRGDVNSETEPLLSQGFSTALNTPARAILLRFDPIASVNGDGIAGLIRLLSLSKQQQCRVGIVGLSPNFKKIFDTVGICTYASLHDTKAEALEELMNN